jgi:hypothetical protein
VVLDAPCTDTLSAPETAPLCWLALLLNRGKHGCGGRVGTRSSEYANSVVRINPNHIDAAIANRDTHIDIVY